MDSIIADVDKLEHDVLRAFASLKKAKPRGVDSSIMAMMCLERDTRFYKETLRALSDQTVLPGTIVIVDCARRTSKIKRANVSVCCASSALSDMMNHELAYKGHYNENYKEHYKKNYKENYKEREYGSSLDSYNKKIQIIIVPVTAARSFGDAIDKALHKLMPCTGVKAMWLLHDDSRPADSHCLEHLRETWRNTPTASVLGAKQVDWDGKILHNVGMYAWHHSLHSLTVEGELDQEQYDNRGDVFSVSLAGALVPLSTWQLMHGVQPWMTTFGESRDFCRRVCLNGGRVVVVPSARIAHRRARFEGIRTRSGDARPEEKSGMIHGIAASLKALQRYRYTDIRIILWPLIWLISVPSSLIMALQSLFVKQPYIALVRLWLPWQALLQLPSAFFVRFRVARSTRVSLKNLSALVADRKQISVWKDRCAAYLSQKRGVLLGPLARKHLHKRILLRWSAALVAALVVFCAVAVFYGHSWREIIEGSTIYTQQWIPTGSSMSQLWKAATGAWMPDNGFGPAIPPSPLLLMWTIASAFTFGNPGLAVTLAFFLSAPAMLLSFWAFAGVFTRSDSVRVCSGICWTVLAMAFGLFARGDLPMLIFMVFLPAAFAFAFHAVGMYVTEDPVKPVPSTQSAACASLCFMVAVAAQPQLLIALFVIFVVAIVMVKSHRPMLALMPIPSILVCLPTLGSVVRYYNAGMWRQIFGSMSLVHSGIQGVPRTDGYVDILLRAFNMNAGYSNAGYSFASSYNPLLSLRGIIMIVFAIIAVVMAIASLALPFALRVSRVMWGVIISGMVLSLISVRIVVGQDEFGPVAGSALPGVVLSAIGVLACICMVAGHAVSRFEPLKVKNIKVSDGVYKTRADRRAAMRKSAELVLKKIAYCARGLLACGIFAMAILLAIFAILSGPLSSVNSSDNGLPMVVVDYLNKDSNRRVLAVRAISDRDVEVAIMRTSRGDSIDESPALRVRNVLYGMSKNDITLSRTVAKLLSHADSGAISTLEQLGFGGIYVVDDSSQAKKYATNSLLYGENFADKSATDRFITNVNASESTQLVVSSHQGTYLRFDNPVSYKSKSSFYYNMRPLAWRKSWMTVCGIVFIMYCLVAVPRFGQHNVLERADDEREESIDELA
ncbi:glycosyltransferase family 2 protein [Gardnerella vaginalis]|uniref:Glycosyltransferase 2-like domain-containing protein n=1 Tax=Gardnerella vaginalis TaxID=2702 RepID=A0A2K1SUP0_GARVA|nr:glycosyltransferase family 2 protein [Gardnerella vaginalis]PNS43225.1 hypothetical protein BFS05_04060 [Gardnerella vaginalis]